MSSDALQIERVGDHVLKVRINRPDKRNAINVEVARGIAEAVDLSNRDETVRAVILCSTGEQSFCAGADLALVAAGRGLELMIQPGGFAGLIEAVRVKPWIAAVDAVALGGGTEICLSCDMVVASTRATFGLPEVKRGVIAGAAGVFRLARRIPVAIAYEMIASGEPIGAERAYALGLINQVVAPGAAEAAALKLASAIAENAPLSVQLSLAVARQAQDLTEGDLFAAMRSAGDRIIKSEDANEGARAFLEKRKPVWKGR